MLTLMVCPHDTARGPEGWRRLGLYLAAQIDTPIRLASCPDFASFHRGMAGADLVYAGPADALALIDRHGFVALARPLDTYDQALLVTGITGPLPPIEAIHGATLAAVEHLLPTRLALAALRARGVAPAGIQHHDSWLSVVRSVWSGEAPFGVLYRDAYRSLSAEARAMVRMLAAPEQGAAFHLAVARPGCCADLGALTRALAAMRSSPEGAAALAAIEIPGWLPITPDDLAGLRAACA